MKFARHSYNYFLGAFAVQSGNGNIVSTVSFGSPLRGSVVVNGISKLRRFKNRKEETEAKIIFLLTWAHERWNSDLAKDRQHYRLLGFVNDKLYF